MSWRSRLPLVILVAHAIGPTSTASATPDRLERFRSLAASRLGAAQLDASSRSVENERELHALVDEEVVQNLTSGGLFATPGFLQERLDGFAETWGDAVFRVLHVGSYTVVAFTLGEGGTNTVRLYGRRGGETALLTTASREGRPAVYPLPAGPRGPDQFLVVWEGASSGRGTRSVRLDLLRPNGSALTTAWSSADLFPDGLVVRSYRVAGPEIRVRYELHYPGWIPGCDGQTEQEDVYRYAPERNTLVRVSRRQFNDWHVTLHQSVARILAAVAKRDRGSLADIIPDSRVRNALPARLERDDACDAREAGGPVSVAAVADTNRPWTLTFLRTGTQWRLTAAGPLVVQ